MFEIIQKLAPAPPTGLYSHVAPLTSWNYTYNLSQSLQTSLCTV